MYRLLLVIGLLYCPGVLLAQERHTIHVLVALCDNVHQGIVPVPRGIGNGQDPRTNLYWGCGYGIRGYFGKSAEWQQVARYKIDSVCLERVVYRHTSKPYYLVADAYNGAYIKQCTVDFLRACAGLKADTLMFDGSRLGLYGHAKLRAYIGHNGLMDFALGNTFANEDGRQRDAIVLACASKPYFGHYLQTAKAMPVLWTTHLMCPEAYTLHDALTGYLNGESNVAIRERAAAAYAKYQKCSIKAAQRLLVTGY